MKENEYIKFDWAVKRMLRNKANFEVLEGLITVLLEEEIHIVELLESEGNQETFDDKFNRVDIKAKNSKGEIIIVEVQLSREVYFLERILYGVAKSITEHINLGDAYDKVKKIYSISIIYFDLGKGCDYLYRGQTTFRGVHTGDTLQITSNERNAIEIKTPEKIFPEYYLIRVNEFNKVATTPLEEWLDYLRFGHIKDDTTTPGLQQARENLSVMKMTDSERQAYIHHMENIMAEQSMILAAQREGHYNGRMEGLMEGQEKGRAQGIAEGRAQGIAEGKAQGIAEGKAQGIAEGKAQGIAEGKAQGIAEGLESGLAKGREEEKRNIAKSMKDNSVPIDVIKNCTGLSDTQIEEI